MFLRSRERWSSAQLENVVLSAVSFQSHWPQLSVITSNTVFANKPLTHLLLDFCLLCTLQRVTVTNVIRLLLDDSRRLILLLLNSNILITVEEGAIWLRHRKKTLIFHRSSLSVSESMFWASEFTYKTLDESIFLSQIQHGRAVKIRSGQIPSARCVA